MRTIITIIVGLLLLNSCDNPKELAPPKEACENVTIEHLPIITHGLIANAYDSVIVQTFRKNSNYDTLINEYKIELGDIANQEREERRFSLPKSVTTGFDLKLIFSNNLIYQITEMKTSWMPRWSGSSYGFECTFSSFKLNGKLNESQNIVLIKVPELDINWIK